MTLHFLRASRTALVASSIAALMTACKESMPDVPRQQLPAAKDIEAGLVASSLAPDAGDTVLVMLRTFAGGNVRPAASFTARVTYDAARLSFDAELASTDAGARVVNGTIPGDVRAAGFATGGFANGDLVTLRFIARTPGGLGTLQLAMDELHATDGEDLKRVGIRATTVDAGINR